MSKVALMLLTSLEVIAESPSGFVQVFNGRDLSGWTGATHAAVVQDGVLVWQADMSGTLYWNEDLRNFQARLEFKLPPGGNNGLAIRYPGSGEAAYSAMCELQILDDSDSEYAHLDSRQYHGSAYGLAAAQRGHLRPVGEWNHQEITVQGSKIRVELNGAIILDTDLSTLDPAMPLNGKVHPGRQRTHGFFGFTGHDDAVQFRNIFIRKLPD
jgi:hypothetical protein